MSLSANRPGDHGGDREGGHPGAFYPDRADNRSRPQRALIIDPIEETARVASFLEGAGFEVRRFGNGSDALRAFSDLSPDLVLFEARVPREMGLDACWEIRKKTRVPSTPVIVATAPESRRRRQVPHWIVEGCDAYLEHTSRSEEFMDIITLLLQARESSGEPPPDPESDPELIGHLDDLFEGLIVADGADGVDGTDGADGDVDPPAPDSHQPARDSTRSAPGRSAPSHTAPSGSEPSNGDSPVAPVDSDVASDADSDAPSDVPSSVGADTRPNTTSAPASAAPPDALSGAHSGAPHGTAPIDPLLDDLEREIESELGVINEQLSSLPLAGKLKSELADADAWAETGGSRGRGVGRVSEPIDFEKGKARARGSLLSLQSGWEEGDEEYEDDDYYDDGEATRRRFALFVSGSAILGVAASLVLVWLFFYSDYVDLEQFLPASDSAGWGDSYQTEDDAPAATEREPKPSRSGKSPFDTSGISDPVSEKRSDAISGTDPFPYDTSALPYYDSGEPYDTGTADPSAYDYPLDGADDTELPAYQDELPPANPN